MKKLLLILICLFASFKVKSKEIILTCEINQVFEGQVPLTDKFIPYEPLMMSLHIKKKHFYKKSINDWEFQIQFVEEPNPYVKLKTHIGETVISTVITTNSPDVGKENEILFTTSYSINRYTGAFTLIHHDYRTKSLGFKKYGKCKKSKRLF